MRRSVCGWLELVAASLVVPLSAIVLLAGCGGGGGGSNDGSGGNFVGAAVVEIDASPKTIDTADRTQLRVQISDVHEDGIYLKIKFPEGLRFVANSSVLTVNGGETDLAPIVNSAAENGVYLVYSFDQDDFGRDLEGELRLQLEAIDELAGGLIEVDADVRTEQAFDIENPNFGAEDGVEIEVIG